MSSDFSADLSTFEIKTRPQSTLALDFAATLDSLFHIDDGLDDLTRNVDEKRLSTNLLSNELAALTNRLRDTEVRLKRARRASMRLSSGQASPQQTGENSDQDSPLAVRTRRSAPEGHEAGEASNTSGSETGEELKGIEEQDDEE